MSHITVIIESGSTKTDLVCIDSQRVIGSHTMQGFNPNYHPYSRLHEIASSLRSQYSHLSIDKIFYYGSGCSSIRAVQTIQQLFHHHIPFAQVRVFHDIFGAARALFGLGTGIAAILGTGSSSCLFRQGCIESCVPSLGYLLADEGSGMHLGKLLINEYFKGSLPEPLFEELSTEINMELPGFIQFIYTHPTPNQYLASLVPFLHKYQAHSSVHHMIRKAFNEFITEILSKYPHWKELPVGFCGSVAFYFKEILTELSVEHGFEIVRIIHKPIDHLVEFHLTYPDE